jgi:acyl carrier protein
MNIELTDVKIKRTVEGILGFNENTIDLDVPLIEYGLDSVKLLQLIVLLEEMFKLCFNDNELVFEKFSSVRKITTLIKTRDHD